MKACIFTGIYCEREKCLNANGVECCAGCNRVLTCITVCETIKKKLDKGGNKKK